MKPALKLYVYLQLLLYSLWSLFSLLISLLALSICLEMFHRASPPPSLHFQESNFLKQLSRKTHYEATVLNIFNELSENSQIELESILQLPDLDTVARLVTDIVCTIGRFQCFFSRCVIIIRFFRPKGAWQQNCSRQTLELKCQPTFSLSCVLKAPRSRATVNFSYCGMGLQITA